MSFESAMATESTTEGGVHLKIARVISSVILLNLPRKKDQCVKMQMLIIVRERWTRWREGKSYPAFVDSRSLYSGRAVHNAVLNVDGKKKATKKQRRSKEND
jgi:hypothetical protein